MVRSFMIKIQNCNSCSSFLFYVHKNHCTERQTDIGTDTYRQTDTVTKHYVPPTGASTEGGGHNKRHFSGIEVLRCFQPALLN